MTTTTTKTWRQTAVCTCCEPARPMSRDIAYITKDFGSPGEERYFESHPDWESNQEWAHDDDEIFAMSAHIHIEACSTDCDSTYDRSTVFLPTHFDPHCDDHNDMWNRVARLYLPFSVSDDEEANIQVRAGHATWRHRTDEGHDSGEMNLCFDPSCARGRDTFRDRTAESRGY